MNVIIRNTFYYTLLLLILVACSVEYDMKPTTIYEPNRLVVNSFLNPQKPICIYFYTIDRIDKGFVYKPAVNMQVKLTEDDRVLFDGLCTDTVLVLDYYPQAKAKYRIDVSLTGYTPVWAETTVPSAITCQVNAEQFDDNYAYSGGGFEMKYILSGFSGDFDRENIAMYVTANTVLGNDELIQCYNLYASNVLFDPINRSNGIEAKDDETGSSCFERYIRVKNKNLPYLDKMIFITYMPSDAHYDTTDRYSPSVFVPGTEKNYLIKVITAGPEYDMYHRTFYLQELSSWNSDDIAGIVYQPVQLYSNINGGLGIFAGMNESNYYFDVPEIQERP